MLAAFEVEVVRSESEFWDLTPAELEYRARAARKRRLDAKVQSIRAAWYGALWSSFSSRLAPWDEVERSLREGRPREMSVKQMENLIGLFASAFPGKLERAPEQAGEAVAGE